MSAVFSDCGLFRYRLDRVIDMLGGPIYAFFGVNGATAGADEDDHTSRKWSGFTKRAGGSRYIAGNPFALCAKNVRKLAAAADPIGPENDRYLGDIIAEADILVPCWGRVSKVPDRLRPQFDLLLDRIHASGKPVLHFGLTACGSPKHPLTLSWSTPLLPLQRAA